MLKLNSFLWFHLKIFVFPLFLSFLAIRQSIAKAIVAWNQKCEFWGSFSGFLLGDYYNGAKRIEKLQIWHYIYVFPRCWWANKEGSKGHFSSVRSYFVGGWSPKMWTKEIWRTWSPRKIPEIIPLNFYSYHWTVSLHVLKAGKKWVFQAFYL